jgi:hypothetical protein
MSLNSSNANADLESVLRVHRRRLTSIDELNSSRLKQRHIDTIYVTREDHCRSIVSIHSKIVIFGELQYLSSIFERHTSNSIVREESAGVPSCKTSFSTTFEDNEDLDVINEHDDPDGMQPVVSTLRKASISSCSSSSSPSLVPVTSPSVQRKKLASIGRSPMFASTVSDSSYANLDSKRYGSIELPGMTIIEVLEILLRTGMDIVDISGNYDSNNVLHQHFVLSKADASTTKTGQGNHSRSLSLNST